MLCCDKYEIYVFFNLFKYAGRYLSLDVAHVYLSEFIYQMRECQINEVLICYLCSMNGKQ